MYAPLIPNRDHPLNNQKMLWWLVTPQNYGGGRVIDLMGNYHGTLIIGSGGTNTSIQFKSPTQIGSRGRLVSDGKGYVQCNNVGFLPTRYTVSLWMNCAVNTQFQGAFTWAANPTDANSVILLQARSSTQVGWVIYNTGSNSFSINNLWTHCALSYDGSNVRIYLNGVFQQTITVSSYSESSAYNIYLNNGYDEPFIGSYDNLEIWRRCLTSQEIYEDYNLYKLGYPNVLYQPKKITYSSSGGNTWNGIANLTTNCSIIDTANCVWSAKSNINCIAITNLNAKVIHNAFSFLLGICIINPNATNKHSATSNVICNCTIVANGIISTPAINAIANLTTNCSIIDTANCVWSAKSNINCIAITNLNAKVIHNAFSFLLGICIINPNATNKHSATSNVICNCTIVANEIISTPAINAIANLTTNCTINAVSYVILPTNNFNCNCTIFANPVIDIDFDRTIFVKYKIGERVSVKGKGHRITGFYSLPDKRIVYKFNKLEVFEDQIDGNQFQPLIAYVSKFAPLQIFYYVITEEVPVKAVTPSGYLVKVGSTNVKRNANAYVKFWTANKNSEEVPVNFVYTSTYGDNFLEYELSPSPII